MLHAACCMLCVSDIICNSNSNDLLIISFTYLSVLHHKILWFLILTWYMAETVIIVIFLAIVSSFEICLSLECRPNSVSDGTHNQVTNSLTMFTCSHSKSSFNTKGRWNMNAVGIINSLKKKYSMIVDTENCKRYWTFMVENIPYHLQSCRVEEA